MLSQTECDEIAQHFFNLPFSVKHKTNHFDFELPERPRLFVKYGSDDLLAQASTQSFFHALAQKDISAPGIPAVYNAFCKDGYCFLVMENVGLPTLEACDPDAVKFVAPAVKWLLDQMSSVPSSLFGRISDTKACVWHPFFKDHEAPVAFVNSEAVNKYTNKVRISPLTDFMAHYRIMSLPQALSYCRGGRTPILLSSELSICHSDIREDNFLLDVTTGRIWIVDFEHVCVFPVPFQQYGFFNIGSPLASEVGKYLGYKEPDIVEAMDRASCVLQQIGIGDLGNYSSSFIGT